MAEYKRISGSYHPDESDDEYCYNGRYTADFPSNWEAKIWLSNDRCRNMFNEYGVTLSGPLGDIPDDPGSLQAVVGLAVEQAIAEWVSTTSAAKWIRWG